MLTVFAAEMTRRLRSRPFWIGTLLGVAFIIGAFQFSKFLSSSITSSKDIVLAGPPQLVARAESLLARDFTVRGRVAALPERPTAAWLDAHHKASAAIVLQATGKRVGAIVYARDLANFPTRRFRADIAPINIALATHIPEERIDELLNVEVEMRGVSTKFASEAAANVAQGVAYALVFILYISIVMNNQLVMSSVAEEKTSRIAELLVATVDPQALLGGKILAGATLGLFQLALWIGAGMLSGNRAFGADTSGGGILGLPISAGEMALLLAFFIIGYVSYATISAAVASLINRTEDLGSVSFPVMMPVVAAILIANFALLAPNSNLVVIASFVPLLSPFVMFTRSVVGDVPNWQIAISIALSLATIVVLVWISAKLYRVGMLLYGKPPKLGQIIAILRA